MNNARLFDRDWLVTVGDLDISGLALEFKVKKTLKREPNTADLKVYNLSEATRTKLTTPKAVTVRIEAGYKGSPISQIYLGEVRSLTPGEQQQANILTELTSGDGEKACQTARLQIPVGAKTSTGDALRAIAATLGVGMGNVDQVARNLDARGVSLFPRGTVLTGNTSRVLSDFCRSAGLEWSIQDGALQILDLGKALTTNPYSLDSDSGLINSPKLDKDGKLTFQTLMLPGLRPGLLVEMRAKLVKGFYRLLECEYSGQTHGQDWSITSVAEKVK